MHEFSLVKDDLIAHAQHSSYHRSINYNVLTIVCPLFLLLQNNGLCQHLCLGGTMPNKRASSQPLAPSQFDKKTKLNVIADRSRTFMRPEEVRAKLLVGHPDAIATGSCDSTCIPCAYQSVYAEQDENPPGWRPCYRFMAMGLKETHKRFFRSDTQLRWKCLYEISFGHRAKNLYFDLEQLRSSSSCTAAEEHDRECWVKVQILQSMVTEVFRNAIFHLVV